MNALVFDIETVPDVEFGRRLFGLEGLSDDEVGKAMQARARQDTGSDFLPHTQHRIVAISCAFRTGDGFRVWSLGEEGSSERELVELYAERATAAGRSLGLGPVEVIEVEARKPGKAAEAEVERTHRLLEAVSEGTTDAIFVKDLAGRYLFINSAGARVLGRPVAEVLGRDDTEVFPPETAGRIMALDRQVMDDNQVHNQEEVIVAHGLTRRFHSMKGPLRDAQGRVIGLIGIARDMTDEPMSR